jgi:hypothetical protein
MATVYIHHSHECGLGISQTKRHYQPLEETFFRLEGSLSYISFLNEGDILHHAKLVFEVYKLHPRLMTLVCQSWETSLSHLNRGETPSTTLPFEPI